MALALSQVSTATKRGPSKLVVGVLVAAMTAFVGLAGVANATSDKPNKDWCKDHGFKNYGQCVKDWAHKKGHGHGYGGGGGGGYGGQNMPSVVVNGNVTTDVGVTVNGNNNVISIVINYLFGSS